MLGPRRSFDRDTSAAARRRLAAIAAEFDLAAPGVDDHELSHRTEPAVAVLEERSAASRSSPGAARGRLPVGSVGRHRGETGALGWGRWQLTLQHVAVLALAVSALVAVAAWWALRSVPDARPVPLASGPPTSTVQAGAVTPGLRTPPDPSASAGLPVSNDQRSTGLVVDVTGRVRRPGIVELPAGSRVVDALQAAGGARPGVDTAFLNLARQLVDGEQIVVGLHVPALGSPAPSLPGAADSGATIAPVNLNTATGEQLDTLPGVGPVTAQSILDWRTENGAFTSVDELLEVSGIGAATLADIEPFVYV